MMPSVTQQFVPQQQQNQNNNTPEPVPNPTGGQLNLQQVSQTNNFGTGNFQQNQQGQIAVTTQPQQQQLNAASLCRVGQETVQEIISRTQELFQILKITLPPDGKFSSIGADRKLKFQELLRTIKAAFKRLRVVYAKIEESFPGDKIVNFESDILQKSGSNSPVTPTDDKRNTDAYKIVVEEYREAMEQVIVRNRNLKDTIDHLRQIIWDVNTMLSMRKE